MHERLKRIGILSSTPSERHLCQPVLEELNKLGFETEIMHIPQNDIAGSYNRVNWLINNITGHRSIKFVLAVADRPEQIGGVLAAFQNRVPVGHLYAGDHNTVATFDDIHRHSITLYSSIQFCSSQESQANVIRTMSELGLKSNSYCVGATHFDGINLDKIKEEYRDWRFNFPNVKDGFILVSINGETLGDDSSLVQEVLKKAEQFNNGHFVQIRGNGDSHVENSVFTRLNGAVDVFYLDRVHHSMYLYLMMNCLAFITNSSAAIYEAPFLMRPDQIIMVGNRNRGRTPVLKEAHDGKASSRVANLVKVFIENYYAPL